MNTHRAVARFLAKEEKKTELKSEKVELGAIQDLDKLNPLMRLKKQLRIQKKLHKKQKLQCKK
jgi:hypothetical protein